ncbi:RRM 1 domain containing protein [Asbolus verrucosus]|uniref:RRM 1 domain containing protein n=1 Tax=Asbolus verrucosus TaxID=1661398 RepID=A0A482VD14_ASBVE|nr:RRM 1 domain containing protein [Asbolus verrucosus]
MRDVTPSNYESLYAVKIMNLGYETTVKELRHLFKKYGQIGDIYIVKNPVTNKSRGFGFVKYYKRQDAIEAAYYLDGEIFYGKKLRVYLTDEKLRRSLASRVRGSQSHSSDSSSDYERKFVTVKVENLPYKTREEDVKKWFYHCGPIADVYIPRVRNSGLNKGYAFVRFYRKHDATFAIANLNNKQYHGRKIRVIKAKYGKPPPFRQFKCGSSPLASKYKKHR